MRENTDQKNFKYVPFSRKDSVIGRVSQSIKMLQLSRWGYVDWPNLEKQPVTLRSKIKSKRSD